MLTRWNRLAARPEERPAGLSRIASGSCSSVRVAVCPHPLNCYRHEILVYAGRACSLPRSLDCGRRRLGAGCHARPHCAGIGPQAPARNRRAHGAGACHVRSTARPAPSNRGKVANGIPARVLACCFLTRLDGGGGVLARKICNAFVSDMRSLVYDSILPDVVRGVLAVCVSVQLTTTDRSS